MEEIKELSFELSNFIKNAPQKDSILQITKHINSINHITNLPNVVIPSGLTWFGVSEPIKQSDLNGKLIVLDFFTYCCINCIHILPHLKAIEEKHKKEYGFAVIGVHSPKFTNEKEDANLLNAIVKLNITHPVVNDPNAILWNQLDISCWPTLLVLDPKGRPIFTLAGEGHHQELDLFVQVALDMYKESLQRNPVPLSETKSPVTSNILSYPGQIAVDDTTIAVCDTGKHRILLISPNGMIRSFIGGPDAGYCDGNYMHARFREPQGVVLLDDNTILVADTGNHMVRKINLRDVNVTSLIGTGHQGTDLEGGLEGLKQSISSPWGLCIVPAPPILQTTSFCPLPLLPPVPSSKQKESSIPPPPPAMPFMPLPPPPPLPPLQAISTKISNLEIDHQKKPKVLLISMSGSHQIWAYFFEDTVWWKNILYEKGICVAVVGSGVEENRNNRYPRSAGLAQPSGLCYSEQQQAVFIADSESSSIRRVCMKTGSVSPVVGGHLTPNNLFSFGDKDGVGTAAQLQHPLDVAWDSECKKLLVADSYNHKLKWVDVTTGTCSTISLSRPLSEPGGICINKNVIYVADTNSHKLLKINQTGYEVTEVDVQFAIFSKSKIRRVWELSIPVSLKGNEVLIKIKLGNSFTGSWKAVQSLKEQVGLITGQSDIFNFTSTDELSFDMDVVECKDDACIPHYYRLLVKPIVSSNSQDSIILLFNGTNFDVDS